MLLNLLDAHLIDVLDSEFVIMGADDVGRVIVVRDVPVVDDDPIDR